jgi:hypothetical protein
MFHLLIENAKRWRPIPNRDQIKLIYTSQSSMQTIQIILNGFGRVKLLFYPFEWNELG